MADPSQQGLQIALQPMRHQTEVWKVGEDWAGVTRTDQRRMLQNRLNQRSYRRKKREGKYSDAIHASSMHKTATAGEQTADQRVATQLQLAQHIANQAYSEYVGRTPRPERLINVLQLNVFNALARNAAALGLGMLWLVCDAVSPFGQNGPCLAGASDSALIPQNLCPTSCQISALHHPWVDVLPWPDLRDKILFLAANELIDEDELWYDMVEFDASRSCHDASLIVWGEPWDPRGWEVNTGFLHKWGWLLKGCSDILEATNYWRHKRGERQLTFKLL
ncbi:hypothetical protein BKA61DRAFT_511638 [Leptodontidium sp. MPI-SDFR-AT-0119]|nr:hypothetical protein BKA61DRAFT_511638 [Leptodontidium sp. MPI-SDFR-AT-0119]